MNQCPTCKAVLEPGVRFCPNDGTPLTDTAAAHGAATPTGGKRPKSVELALPTVVGGRYKLVEMRGGGGMAKVYKAEDLTLERTVAVKLINPELRTETEFDARFQREARIASQLQDPHIVAVHDFGIDAAHGPFLVMEFLEGQSLRERLNTGGPLPLKAALQIGGQLVLALMHAHDKGIVHRDIKPDNIFLVSQSGVRIHVRVLDFGIARILRRDDPGQGHTLTSPGAVLGTPRYMSPEQLAGQPLDARSDIFSAALVIHEALTGQLPYVTGKRLCELCPEATAPLQDLLEHCLKPAAHDRPQTAVEVYLRLQELGKASGILLLPPGAIDAILRGRKSATPAGGSPPTVGMQAATVPHGHSPDASRTRRRVLIAMALVLLVLGGAAFAKWYLFRSTVPAPDSLLGIRIDDSFEDAEQTKVSRKMYHKDLKAKGADLSLGHVLTPELDFDRDPPSEIAWTEDKKVVILYTDPHVSHPARVKAVIVHEPYPSAVTGRGVRLHDYLRAVTTKYDTVDVEAYVKTVTEIGNGDEVKLEVRRYDALGIGFELRQGKVVSITLYPPVTKK